MTSKENSSKQYSVPLKYQGGQQSQESIGQAKTGMGMSSKQDKQKANILNFQNGENGAVAVAAESVLMSAGAIKSQSINQNTNTEYGKKIQTSIPMKGDSATKLRDEIISRAAQSDQVLKKNNDRQRATSGQRTNQINMTSGRTFSHNNPANDKMSIYNQGMKPHHLIIGTSTFGGGVLSGIGGQRESSAAILNNQNGQKFQNQNMYSVGMNQVHGLNIGSNNARSLTNNNYLLNKSGVGDINSHFHQNHANVNLGMAERRISELVHNFKKKEKQNRETIEGLQKKLKQQEIKAQEETKISIELKKRHDVMYKKLQIAIKDKGEVSKQLKQLFMIFTKQRKALEMSIRKNKKYEMDQLNHENILKEKDRQNQNLQQKLDQLEQQKETILQRHRQEVDNLNHEIQEKRLNLQRIQNENTEAIQQKFQLKQRLDEYEDKIRSQIKEFEEISKKHIKEISEIHENYRGYKTRAIELEQRIDNYRKDALASQKAERNMKRQLVQITFNNDEIEEKCQYLEQKYHALVKRMGASQEDIDMIEEEIMLKNNNDASSSMTGNAQQRPNYKSKGLTSGQPSKSRKKNSGARNNQNQGGKYGYQQNFNVNSSNENNEMQTKSLKNSNQINNRKKGKYGYQDDNDSKIELDDIIIQNDDDQLQSLRHERDSQNMSRLDHHIKGQSSLRGHHNREEMLSNSRSMRSGEGAASSETNNNEIITQGHHHNPGMVDSYEIYGENNNDDIEESEVELDEDNHNNHSTYSQNNRRGSVIAGGRHVQGSQKGMIGDQQNNCIMISGEHVIENQKLKNNYAQNNSSSTNNYKFKNNSSSNINKQRKISQKRESSGVKKTNIEVLDHETPIEEYQQYYNEMHDGSRPQKNFQNNIMNERSSDDIQQQHSSLQEMQNTLGTESNDLFNNLFANLTTSQPLQNEHIKQQFKLELIKDEEDLHNYKNLLNAMAAIFFTSHRMKQSCKSVLQNWYALAQQKQMERGNVESNQQFKVQKNKQIAMNNQNHFAINNLNLQAARAVPAIQIDTELANMQYENQNELEQQFTEELVNGIPIISQGGNSPPELHLDQQNIPNLIDVIDNSSIIEQNLNQNDDSESQKSDFEIENANNPDAIHDHRVKKFLKDLQKVGPFSKQILNYSYPPLLYQRGDESEDDQEEGEDEMGEDDEINDDDEDLSHNQFPLDDDFNVENLLGRELGGIDDDIDVNNADLRQNNMNDDMDGMNDLNGNEFEVNQQMENVIDGLFNMKDQKAAKHQPGAAVCASTEGIENVDVSDIQKMINRSAESGSPGLDQFNHEMLDGLQFDEFDQDAQQYMQNQNFLNEDDQNQEFYDNLKRGMNQIDHENYPNMENWDEEEEYDQNDFVDINDNQMNGFDYGDEDQYSDQEK